jgi:aminoacylase
VHDKFGKPLLTATDSSNPWWALLEEAVRKANGKIGKPEIFPAATDSRYFRERGFLAIGFSPMANTPILLHDHNEVSFFNCLFIILFVYEYKIFV